MAAEMLKEVVQGLKSIWLVFSFLAYPALLISIGSSGDIGYIESNLLVFCE